MDFVPLTPTLFPPAEIDDLLVGPESITWRRASDARLHLVMALARATEATYGGSSA